MHVFFIKHRHTCTSLFQMCRRMYQRVDASCTHVCNPSFIFSVYKNDLHDKLTLSSSYCYCNCVGGQNAAQNMLQWLKCQYYTAKQLLTGTVFCYVHNVLTDLQFAAYKKGTQRNAGSFFPTHTSITCGNVTVLPSNCTNHWQPFLNVFTHTNSTCTFKIFHECTTLYNYRNTCSYYHRVVVLTHCHWNLWITSATYSHGTTSAHSQQHLLCWQVMTFLISCTPFPRTQQVHGFW